MDYEHNLVIIMDINSNQRNAVMELDACPDANAEALIPQLSEFGITEQHLATAIRVLDAVSSLGKGTKKKQQQKKKRKSSNLEQATDSGTKEAQLDQDEIIDDDDEDEGLVKYRQPNLRQFRKSLAACLSLHQKAMYGGKTELKHFQQRIGERTLKRQKIAEKAQQRKYVAATELRRGRVDRLEKLREESKEEEEAKLMRFLVPDGHVDTTTTNGVKMLENGKEGGGSTCEDWISSLSQTTTCGGDGRGHDTFPKQCRLHLSERRGLSRLEKEVACVWIGFEGCYRSRGVHAIFEDKVWPLWH